MAEMKQSVMKVRKMLFELKEVVLELMEDVADLYEDNGWFLATPLLIVYTLLYVGVPLFVASGLLYIYGLALFADPASTLIITGIVLFAAWALYAFKETGRLP